MNEYPLSKLQKDAEKNEYGYSVLVKVGMFKDPIAVSLEKINKLHSEIISDLVRTNEKDLKALRALLLFDYIRACGLCDYGRSGDRDNPFDIHTPDDAFSKSKITGITIHEPEKYRSRWSVIDTIPEWEAEHGVCIAVRNGIIHGVAEDYNFPYPTDSL